MAWREDTHFTKLRLGGDANNGVAPIVMSNKPARASFTIGTEASDAITVNIQLKDYRDKVLAIAGSVIAYLSSDSAGQVLEAASAGLSNAAGTDGMLIELSTDNCYVIVSETDGDMDFVITETTGANTFYLNLVMPDGSIVTSGAITFAA